MALADRPGRISQEQLPEDGLRYTLSLPAELEPDAAVPLVVSLHYGGPVSPWYGRGLLESVVEPALRPLGAVMVAPDCSGPAWAEPACTRAVFRVMEAVKATYRIDSGRVFLTGYSKGGIGTWAIAAEHAGRFTAAVVMAGQPPQGLAPEAWQLPMRVIHAGADELLPLAPVEQAVKALRDAGADVELTVLDGVGHYDTGSFTVPLRDQLPWLTRF